MKTINLLASLAILLCFAIFAAAPLAHAAILTVSLTANPSTINEGGQTQFTISLEHTPYADDLYWTRETLSVSSSSIRYRYFYADGTGEIVSVSSSLDPGDGQSSISVSGGVGSNSTAASRTVQYGSPGTYTASLAGTATLSDGRKYDDWLNHRDSIFSPWHWEQLSNDLPASDWVRDVSINATAQVNVSNLNPTITSTTWDALVFAGDTVSFAALGYDPAGVGTSEIMGWAYDLDGDGQYDDLTQTGTLSSNGTTSFADPGTYTIGIQLTDGIGGVAYNTFDVTVLAIPEPSTLLLGALASLGLLTPRRRKK